MSDESADEGRFEGVKTVLHYALAWLLLGYGGYQLAGWTGAVLLPLGVTVTMALLVAPALVAILGGGVIIHSIKGFRAAKRRLSAVVGRSNGGDSS